MLLVLLMEVLQRRRVEQAADADWISAGYQSVDKMMNDISDVEIGSSGFNCTTKSRRRKKVAIFLISSFPIYDLSFVTFVECGESKHTDRKNS